MSSFESIDHALVSTVVERHIGERAFVIAAETVDQNVPLRRVEVGEMTAETIQVRGFRQELMSKVVVAALDKGDVGALREVVGRYMTDLTCDVLERLVEHPELGDMLYEDAFQDAPTKVGLAPTE